MARVETTRELRGLRVRATFLVAFLLVLFGALLARYFHLMVIRHGELSARSLTQLRRTEIIRPPRGSILDRKGHGLALTQKVPSMAVNPARVAERDRPALAERIARILEIQPEFVLDQLSRKKRFRWLRRQIRDPRIIARLADLDHPALEVRDELARSYPAGSVGAHLVGFTDPDAKGLAGAEWMFEKVLSGKPGRRVILRDGNSRRYVLGGSAAPGSSPCVEGGDVVLAMDLAVQTFAEEALTRAVTEWTPKSAVAVVLDPRNGDVLAIAGRPGFDPMDRSAAPTAAFRIGAVADTFEIGSTMKPLIAAAALDRGAVSFDESFDCTTSGSYRIGSRTLHDYKAMGLLTFAEVVIKSSNIGMAQVASRLGVDRTYRFVRALGLGEKTGSGLPGEVGGTVLARREWNETWALPSVAIGHDLTVTPLQFTVAFATLLNGGILYRPRVALKVGEREISPEPIRQVLLPDVTREVMVPTLVRVVEEGTGQSARVPGYRVGGKTGTAQVKKAGEVVGYVSSFIGFAPAEDPRFLVLMLLSHPTRSKGTPYGGSCAGPYVGEILARCLRYAEIPPSDPVEAGPVRQAPRNAVPAALPTAEPAGHRSNRDIDRLQFEQRRQR